MKKFLISLITVIITSCTIIRNSEIYNDDIYCTTNNLSNNNLVIRNNTTIQNQSQLDSNQYNQENYHNQNQHQLTFYQDYHEYTYSARIRRFYSGLGFNYYDPWYTNIYWYNYDPIFLGTSPYVTYGWWYHSPWIGYSWVWGIGTSWVLYPGWPWYYNWVWIPRWNNVYWNGYWNGYYNSLNYGLFSNYYYNSFNNNRWYYGPRNSSTVSGRGTIASGYRNLGKIHQTTTRDNLQIHQINTQNEKSRDINTNTVGEFPTKTYVRKDTKSQEGLNNPFLKDDIRTPNNGGSKKPVDNIKKPNTVYIQKNNNKQPNTNSNRDNYQEKNIYYKQIKNKPQYNYNNNIGSRSSGFSAPYGGSRSSRISGGGRER